jgi:hypothetical protein
VGGRRKEEADILLDTGFYKKLPTPNEFQTVGGL